MKNTFGTKRSAGFSLSTDPVRAWQDRDDILGFYFQDAE